MMKLLVGLVTGLFMFCLVGIGNAEILSFNIQGSITKVYDNEGYINGSISEGNIFSGTLTYDTSVADSNPQSQFASYYYNTMPNCISVTISGITFKTDSEDVNFYICVDDNGPGFSPAMTQNIFQAYKRLNSELPGQQQKGTGMGLYLSRQLAKKMEGRLMAHSEGRGKGAQFKLILKRKK